MHVISTPYVGFSDVAFFPSHVALVTEKGINKLKGFYRVDGNSDGDILFFFYFKCYLFENVFP
jgi:hypothetical protein